MRDKKRIDPFLAELGQYWKSVPDWRFGQLMVNIFRNYEYDSFYLEDEKMMEHIRKCFNAETQEQINGQK